MTRLSIAMALVAQWSIIRTGPLRTHSSPKGPDDRHQCQRGRRPRTALRAHRHRRRLLPRWKAGQASLKEPGPPNVGGQDQAAHRGADRSSSRTWYVQILDVPVPQMVEQLLEVLKAVGHRGARAGHRSAQGLSRLHPKAPGGLRSSSSADGGTVDGSADRLVSRRADR